MNIAVCISVVPDSGANLSLANFGNTVSFENIPIVMNPFDEYAVEEAIRIKERNGGNDVIHVITIGNSSAVNILRKALALGADFAHHINGDNFIDSISIAKILAGKIQELSCTVVLMGKQSIDYENAVVGPATAQILGYHCIASCTRISIDGESVIAEKQIQGGTQMIESCLPIVLTVDKGLNSLRFPTLKGTLASKKKTIAVTSAEPGNTSLEQLNLEATAENRHLQILPNDEASISLVAKLIGRETGLK